ncbi:MAG: hypothetical protein FVQ82_09025 [Planctomycetes bacterium]|nr:hypothetical protein [Planctomycetota bacterium]
MIQCKDCEYCEISEDGRKAFKCDPFSNIKEPECLQKMQIMRLDMLAASYRSMLYWQEKMGPMQNKLFKYVEREIDDIDETESWKYQDDPDGEGDEGDEETI